MNREIWNEYLPDFLARISQLNITLGPDSHGRTPAHYAAKNGQTTLLKHLLELNVTINSLDSEGLSELWYAVSSNSVECVQVIAMISECKGIYLLITTLSIDLIACRCQCYPWN